MSVSRSLSLTLSLCMLLSPAASVVADVKNGFDLSDAAVPPEQIFWGGVQRDGIPSINRPRFVTADKAGYLRQDDRVIGIVRNGIAKAYPIRILERHEVVNDRFANDRIVVTYCPLCFSGMAFSIDASSKAQTFGVSGLLFNSDVLLYDHQTNSLWSQLMSTAISGPLKDSRIPAIPALHTTWRDWLQRYPETVVLSRDTGYRFDYRRSPYRDYQRSARLMFPVNARDRSYRNKEWVLGVRIDGVNKAYPFSELRAARQSTIPDVIAGQALSIEYSERDRTARVIGANGDELASVIVYWFAWYAFHPDTAVYQAGAGSPAGTDSPD